MNIDLKKLQWNCRRGMLELDVILIPFVENYFSELSASQQHVFVSLLDEADPDLFNWFMGNGHPEREDFKMLVDIIRLKTRV